MAAGSPAASHVMECLDDAAIDRFVAGGCDAEALRAVDVHLDRCPACRDRVAGRALAAGGHRAGPPSVVSDEVPAGRVIADRYRVLRALGRGGMGTVYEAEHLLIGRRVALKLLHPRWVASEDVVRRFQNEARAVGALGHPGIVQALDMGRTDDGVPFLVLELLEGRDLGAELVARGRLPPEEAVAVVLQVADAVGGVHAMGVVHRDLKPENIFLTQRGEVKVLDFGISKFGISKAVGASTTGSPTSPGALLGTPAYMAPEQLEDASRATERSDVYSLGVILYRALTGALPFEADTLPALVLSIASGGATPPTVLCPGLPRTLSELLLRAMDVDPEQRPASMEELAAALRDHGEPSLASPSPRLADRRVAVVLVVEGCRDAERCTQRVAEATGRVVAAEMGRLVAVFGEEPWVGDEVARAIDVGLALRSDAASVGVAAGHVERHGDGLRGDAVARARRAAAKRLSGVGVEGPTRAVENAYEIRPVDGSLVEVRGRSSSRGGAPSHLGSLLESQPLLGREVEVAQLRAALERLVEGRPTVVGIRGGAGMGKSRLVAELLRLADVHLSRATVLVGRAAPRTGALGVLADALANRAHWAAQVQGRPRLDADAGLEERREAVRGLVGEALAGGASDDLEPFLGELLGVPMAATRELLAARANPRLMGDRLGMAVTDTLEGLARRGTLLLVLEDLQWADDTSLARLEHWIRHSEAEGPIAIVGTARPDAVDSLPPFDETDAIDVHLRGLGESDVQTLAAWVTGREIGPDLARQLAEHTGGNPLFLEQILRALDVDDADRGDASRGDASRDGADREAPLPLPVDVEAAVQARLDALTEVEREVLRRAAVWGGPVDAGLLAELGVPHASVELGRLARGGLLRRRTSPTGVAWEIRSSLTADVVIRALGDETRRRLHRQAGALAARRSEPDLARVAMHFEQADLPHDAATYHHRAALAAARRHDVSAVHRYASRALALDPPEPARFSLEMLCADALEVEGRLDQQGEALGRAARWAATPEERARVAMASAVRTLRLEGAAASLPEFERAVAEAQFTEARSTEDASLLARALGRSATALVYVGRLDEAAGRLAEVDRLVMTRAHGVRAEAASYRAQLAGAQGDLGARRSAYLATVELYRELGDLRNTAGASVNLADVYNRFGAHAEAEAALTEALAQCRQLRMGLMEGYALVNRGFARTMRGDLDGARADLDAALEVARRTGDARLLLFARLYRARARLEAGEPSGAVAEALEVIEDARALGAEPAAVLAQVVLARARLAEGDPAAARRVTTEAMAVRARLGGLEEGEAELFAAHADALDADGDPAAARAVREEGLGLLRRRAERILDPVWRRRFLDRSVVRRLSGR